MAKHRIINTQFWVDNYTANLDPVEKLLFLYVLTNPATEICGIYQLPLRNIALDTGIDKDMVEKILKRFKRDKKVLYIDGWVCVLNFTKHQAINPSVEKGIKRCFGEVPSHIRQAVDSLVQPGTPNLTKLNLTKPNLSESTPKEKAEQFFSSAEMQTTLAERMVEKGIAAPAASAEVAKFVSYWTEPNPSGTKQRWQMEKTFDVQRRFSNWINNAHKFAARKSTTSSQLAEI